MELKEFYLFTFNSLCLRKPGIFLLHIVLTKLVIMVTFSGLTLWFLRTKLHVP